MCKINTPSIRAKDIDSVPLREFAESRLVLGLEESRSLVFEGLEEEHSDHIVEELAVVVAVDELVVVEIEEVATDDT
jgi:hypothetical protein